MRIAFDLHEFVYLDAAGNADAPDVVACQINQHDVFGSLFGIVFQFFRQLLIALYSVPRGRVPAMGRMVTSLSSKRTSNSGDAPTM